MELKYIVALSLYIDLLGYMLGIPDESLMSKRRAVLNKSFWEHQFTVRAPFFLDTNSLPGKGSIMPLELESFSCEIGAGDFH